MAMSSTDSAPVGEGGTRMSSDGISVTAAVVELDRVTTEVFRGSNHAAATAIVTEVEQMQCECCGLAEDCTPAYIAHVRGLYCGRWVCGLCAEAVKEEHGRAGGGSSKEGLDEGLEDALRAHMSLCMQFNKPERMGSPVADIAAAMRRLLRPRMDGSSSPRSAPSTPNRRSSINRRNSSISPFSRGFEAPL